MLLWHQNAVDRELSKKTWTGTYGTVANSADPDQTPQNSVSNQDLHCLFKLQIALMTLHSEKTDPPVLSVL